MMAKMKEVDTQVGINTKEKKFSFVHMAYKGEAKIQKGIKMQHRFNTILIPLKDRLYGLE